MSEDSRNQAWAVYLRVSSEDVQYPERSIPRQRRKIQTTFLDHSDLPVYREYHDFVSGKVVDRSQYQQMMANARDGRFSHLALAEGSRFGRDLEEWISATRELIELGVKIKPADMPSLDVDTPDGFFIAVVMGGLAEREIRVMGERIKGGMQEKFLKGFWPFKAPDGYKNVKEEVSPNKWNRWVEVDPERGPIHTLMFDLYATGQHALETVADELNREHRLPNGSPWTAQTVYRRLINPFYVGRMVSPKWDLEVEGKHEPLVDEETWEKCQRILKERGETRRDGVRFRRGSGRIYPLVGILWSAETGTPFYGTTCKGRARWISYYRTRVPYEGIGKCIYVQARVVHEQILTLFQEIHISDSMAEDLRRMYQREVDQEVEKWFSQGEPQRLRRRIAELENERRVLLRFALREMVADEEYMREKRRIEKHIVQLQKKLSSIEERNQDVAGLLNRKFDLLSRMGSLWSQATPLQQRALGREVFKRITIDREGEIVNRIWVPPAKHLVAGINRDGIEALRWVLRTSSLLEDVRVINVS